MDYRNKVVLKDMRREGEVNLVKVVVCLFDNNEDRRGSSH